MPPLSFVGLGAVFSIVSLCSTSPIPKGTWGPYGWWNEGSWEPNATWGFSVGQSIPKPFTPGPLALANAYRRYGGYIPSDVQGAASAAVSSNASVTTSPQTDDSEYLCAVNIGGQTLNLDFDTGSADLWVFSSELPSAESAGHTVYNPSQSSTAQELNGYTWDITYADGSSALGNVYQDTVTIGSAAVTGQAVELAQQVSSGFTQDTSNDGVLGLAFSSINTVQPTRQLNFLDNAFNQGILQNDLFTADLQKGQPGTYDFGYINSSRYTGDITYTPVSTSRGFWEITSTGYGIEGGSFNLVSIDAIADTGTSLLLMDSDIVSTYYSQVAGAAYDSAQGGYTFPCGASLPSLAIGIGSYPAVVPGSYLTYAQISSTSCFGGLQSNSDIGFSIFGDVFLKSQFVVFDSGNLQLGVAAKNLPS